MLEVVLSLFLVQFEVVNFPTRYQSISDSEVVSVFLVICVSLWSFCVSEVHNFPLGLNKI